MKLLIILSILLGAFLGRAQSCHRVGTKVIPPFAIVEPTVTLTGLPQLINETSWRGYSSDVWRDMVRRFPEDQQCFTVMLYDTQEEGLQAVRDGTLDIFVAGTTITTERGETLDFLDSYRNSGSHVMTHNNVETLKTIGNALGALFSTRLLLVLLMIIVFAIGIGFMVFVADQMCQHPSRSLFRNNIKDGLPRAMTWAGLALAQKPVERPVTPCTYFWLFALTIIHFLLVGLVYAGISHVVEESEASLKIQGIDDLHGKLVGTIRESTSFDSLTRDAPGTRVVLYDGVEEMFSVFTASNTDLDAIYFDSPVLIYARATDPRFKDKVVVGHLQDLSDLGFAIPDDHNPTQELYSAALRESRRAGKLLQIRNSWFADALNDSQEEDTTQSTLIILGILAGAIIVIAGVCWAVIKCIRVRRVKKYMAEKKAARFDARTSAAPAPATAGADAHTSLNDYWKAILGGDEDQRKAEDEMEKEILEKERKGEDIRFLTEYDIQFHLARAFRELRELIEARVGGGDTGEALETDAEKGAPKNPPPPPAVTSAPAPAYRAPLTHHHPPPPHSGHNGAPAPPTHVTQAQPYRAYPAPTYPGAPR